MPDPSQGWAILTLFVMHAILCVLTGLYARRVPEHRAIFRYFVAFFVTDRVRNVLDQYFRTVHSSPYVGWSRALLHVDQFLYLAPRFGFVWLCAIVFEDKRVTRFAVAGLALSTLAMIASYPEHRDQAQAFIYTAAEVGVLFLSWVAVLRAILSSVSSVQPGVTHLVILVLLGADSVSFLMGFLDKMFQGMPGLHSSWTAIVSATLLAYGVCTYLYATRLIQPNVSRADA